LREHKFTYLLTYLLNYLHVLDKSALKSGGYSYHCAPLSPSSIILNRPTGGVISLAGKVTAGPVKSNGSLPPGLGLSHLSGNRAQLSIVIQYGTTLLYRLLTVTTVT